MNYPIFTGCFYMICLISTTSAVQCYGTGKTIKSPRSKQDMYVLTGANGWCIAVMFQRNTFCIVEDKCDFDFVNDGRKDSNGELLKKENEKFVLDAMDDIKKVHKVVGFWVGFLAKQPNMSCVSIDPLQVPPRIVEHNDSDCGTVHKEFICQYRFNYDCLFKNLEPEGNLISVSGVCKFRVQVVWQHSDFDHTKNCKPDEFEIMPSAFCAFSKPGKLVGTWSEWSDSTCSKACVDGYKQIFRGIEFEDAKRKRILLNLTLTMTCNTYIQHCIDTMSKTRSSGSIATTTWKKSSESINATSQVPSLSTMSINPNSGDSFQRNQQSTQMAGIYVAIVFACIAVVFIVAGLILCLIPWKTKNIPTVVKRIEEMPNDSKSSSSKKTDTRSKKSGSLHGSIEAKSRGSWYRNPSVHGKNKKP